MPELDEIQNRVNRLFGSLPTPARPTTVTSPALAEATTGAVEARRPTFFSEFINEHIEEATTLAEHFMLPNQVESRAFTVNSLVGKLNNTREG